MSKNNKVYSQLSLHDHVLQRPNIYIGSIDNEQINNFIYNPETNTIIQSLHNYNPGLIKIISEIIENSTDESVRNPTTTTIKININNEEVSVYNDGEEGIEIIKRDNGQYLPEFLFSELLTSSNYIDNNTEELIGVNGIGAKATNIFSNYFNIEILDKKNKKYYNQSFENNMKIKHEPIVNDIKPKRSDKSYTKITFKPDLKRFKLNELSEDIINIIHKKAIDISLTSKKDLNVYFNDELIKIKNLNDYINLYYPNIDPSYKIVQEINNKWNIGIVYTPDCDFQQISFINNAITIDGGTHVNYILNIITKHFTNIIKNKCKDAVIRPSYISDNLSLFVIANISNPTFESQSKTKLKSRITSQHVSIPENILSQLSKLPLVQNVIDTIIFKKQQELKKTDGKKSRRVDVNKYIPAKKAGTAQSQKCRLIITEGDSAKTFGMYGIEVIGSDYFGIYPIRGKMLNTRDVGISKVLNNKEISDIKTILGIKHNKVYNKDNISELNYGGILILTDQDLDGFHIKGLVMNFVHTFWRELLQIEGFFQTIQTPIIKAFKNNSKRGKISNPNTTKIFYSMTEYDKWSESIGGNINQWTIKYYKGLGTSTKDEAKECFYDFENKRLNFVWEPYRIDNEGNIINISNEPINEPAIESENLNSPDSLSDSNNSITDNQTVSDNKILSDSITPKKRGKKKQKEFNNEISDEQLTISDEAFLLAFSKDKINDRKTWLENYDKNNIFEPIDQKIPYSEFINKELIHFSNYDNIRSIPSICDGLKPSQRKILFTVLEKNKGNKEIKVANLASIVSDRTNYLHGEVSLNEAIVKMAQQYPGSNNINYLKPQGNFGTRRLGGEDSSATRYLFTYLETLTPFIFKQEDNVILNYLEEEGKIVEPEVYYPIIPMCLVNGTRGIGTGFSSRVPMFNPIDIIDNLNILISNELNNKNKILNEMIPWYRGYEGEIIKKDDNTYISNGRYELINRRNENKIKITELPIEVWTDKYYDDMKNKEFIKYSERDASPDNVSITFTVEPGIIQQLFKDDKILEAFNLTNTIKLTNLVLYNNEGRLYKYNSQEDILRDFYNIRKLKYKERQDKYIQILENLLNILFYKIKFINEYISRDIIIERKKKAEIIQQLIERGYPKLSTDINAIEKNNIIDDNDANKDEENINSNKKVTYKTYSYIIDMKLFSLTEEKIEELEKQYELKKAELEKYKNTHYLMLWKNELSELKEKYNKWIKTL